MAHRLIVCTETPSSADFLAIFNALDDETALVAGHAKMQPLAVLLHDCKGVVIGGLWARTVYLWLVIEMLFVPPALRGQGLGAALMRKAERAARDRGCTGVQVTTFDFQAESFYRHLGFSVFGVQEDVPPGHKLLYLSKRLDGVSPQFQAEDSSTSNGRSTLLNSSQIPSVAPA